MSAGSRLPPFAVLQRALAETTERLARELATPTLHAPEWNELEWRIAHAVAAMQGTSMLLASHLRWRGGAEWQAFLERQCQHSVRRHQRALSVRNELDA